MYRVGPKMNFIIWIYLEDPIRVGESKNLLKTYTHSCEPAEGGRGNLNRDFLLSLVMLRRWYHFAPRSGEEEDRELN